MTLVIVWQFPSSPPWALHHYHSRCEQPMGNTQAYGERINRSFDVQRFWNCSSAFHILMQVLHYRSESFMCLLRSFVSDFAWFLPNCLWNALDAREMPYKACLRYFRQWRKSPIGQTGECLHGPLYGWHILKHPAFALRGKSGTFVLR